MKNEMTGKRCIVTGANSGIGLHTALGLARLGAEVVLICRDRVRGEAARDAVRRESNGGSAHLLIADLSSQKQIRRVAKEFLSKFHELHILVNNAGIMAGERAVTEEGIEQTFALNHLGYFLLTHLLLEILKKSAPARIVSVSSMGHFMGKIDLGDLNLEEKYSAMRAYNASKLANVLFTYELARRLKGTGVTANCLHPGVVGSNFASGAAWWMKLGMMLGRPFILPPDKGARTSIHLASSREAEGVTGRYFVRCKPAKSSPASYDETLARGLWEASELLTGMSDGRIGKEIPGV